MKPVRPIVVFDIESTGVDVANDRIVQIAMLKVTPLSGFDLENCTKEVFKSYVNPGRPIPNSEIHGITDEIVATAPFWKDIAPTVAEFIAGCDLCAYNGKRFDIPFIAEELGRAGIAFSLNGVNVIDPFLIYKILNPQTLSAAYKHYTGQELDGAHDAMVDVNGTFEVLKAMIGENDVPADVAEIVKFQMNGDEHDSMVDFAGKFTRDKEGVIRLAFGKHKGEPVMEHLDFIGWMRGKDFTRDTLNWCETFLKEARGEMF